MISGWILGLALYFTLLFAVVIVLLMRILSIMEIVVRAIPLGNPRVQERRPPSSTGAHSRTTQEIV